ncbi:MAG: tyrosine-type recombinase/integrase [Gammaproteobacteria bacterium]|nr:tyrosine-type recombinase/integrase [Gammaproteobacteria bacterium]
MLWEVAGGQDYPFGPFVQLMLATGQRRDELVNMQWADVDGDRWTQSDNKGGRTHIVPLHPLAKGILADLPRFKNATLLFSTTTTTPVSGFSKYKKRLDKAIAAAKVQHKLEGVFDAHWTLHDLRRTMTTHLRQMRIDRDVCSRLLNHAPKGITAKVYDQWEMLDERPEAGECVDRSSSAPSTAIPTTW